MTIQIKTISDWQHKQKGPWFISCVLSQFPNHNRTTCNHKRTTFRIMDFYSPKTLHPVYNCNIAKIFRAPLFPSSHVVMGKLYLLFVKHRTRPSSTQQQRNLNTSKAFGSVLKLTFLFRWWKLGENWAFLTLKIKYTAIQKLKTPCPKHCPDVTW